MKTTIIKKIEEIEKEYSVTVLFAVEVGSRIWGYSHDNSDFDVRFVYKSMIKDYLSLQSPPEVINETGEKVDMQGWDLYKALNLARKSNPSLVEWVTSPIVYYEQSPLRKKLLTYLEKHVSFKSLGHHYLKMANSNLKKVLNTTMDPKVILQIIRGLVMANYIVTYQKIPPLKMEEVILKLKLDDKERFMINSIIRNRGSDSLLQEKLLSYFTEEAGRLGGKLEKVSGAKANVHLLEDIIYQTLDL